jgi:hypothetical protein
VSRRSFWSFAAGVAALAAPFTAGSQIITDAHTRLNVPAGFGTERYLRALQVAGIAPYYPWSVRGFGPDELARVMPVADSTHPWQARMKQSSARYQLYVLAPGVEGIYNTTAPYGNNDGALWAGRGLTTDLKFGFGASAGPVSLVVAPEAFRAENRGFPLRQIASPGASPFADPYNPKNIDEPQRFGDRSYQRFDPGQSTLRIAPGPVAFGFSTANEYWGPAVDNPVILGNNAAGFPHVFAGTSHPLDLWIATVHTRVIWGRLDQSSYSPLTQGDNRRFGTGLVGLVTVRGLPGLEVGVSRFYHERWPRGGPRGSDINLPFTLHNFAASRANLAGMDATNQLASVFARWVFPDAGIEAYGEFGREDFGTDINDVIAEPDHDAAYTVGVQRVWKRGGNRLVAFRAEAMDSRITHLVNVRRQTPMYVHSPVTQGHTQLGQVLGSPAGRGGGAIEFGVDMYDPRGQWTFEASRLFANSVSRTDPDVYYAVTAQRLWFGRHADYWVALTPSIELNRTPGVDAGNFNFRVGTLVHW